MKSLKNILITTFILIFCISLTFNKQAWCYSSWEYESNLTTMSDARLYAELGEQLGAVVGSCALSVVMTVVPMILDTVPVVCAINQGIADCTTDEGDRFDACEDDQTFLEFFLGPIVIVGDVAYMFCDWLEGGGIEDPSYYRSGGDYNKPFQFVRETYKPTGYVIESFFKDDALCAISVEKIGKIMDDFDRRSEEEARKKELEEENKKSVDSTKSEDSGK